MIWDFGFFFVVVGLSWFWVFLIWSELLLKGKLEGFEQTLIVMFPEMESFSQNRINTRGPV